MIEWLNGSHRRLNGHSGVSSDKINQVSSGFIFVGAAGWRMLKLPIIDFLAQVE